MDMRVGQLRVGQIDVAGTPQGALIDIRGHATTRRKANI